VLSCASSTQALEQRVVARGDVLGGQGFMAGCQQLGHRGKGAPVLGQRTEAVAAPQVLGRAVALVAVEAVVGVTLVQRVEHAVARDLGQGSTRRKWRAPARRPDTMASASTSSAGSRLPSTSTFGRLQAQALHRAAHGQHRGLQDVEAVDLGHAGLSHAAAQGLGPDLVVERVAARGVSRLESARPGWDEVIQNHRGRHHRPGQRAAAGLVHAGDQPRHVPEPARSVQADKNFFDRIGGQLRRVAAQEWCRWVKLLGHARGAGRLVEPGQRFAGQRLGGGGALQQLGHHELAAQNVGQTHPGLQPLAPHELPGEPVHVVRDHHRALEQRGLQRGGAAGDQRDVAGGSAACDSGRPAPAAQSPGRGRDGRSLAQRGHGGQDKPEAGRALPA
jgi:hypothetical protein